MEENKTERVSVTNADLFTFRINDSLQTIELFGEDYLEEYGIDIPQDLLNRYKRNIKEYREIQEEIYQITKEKE